MYSARSAISRSGRARYGRLGAEADKRRCDREDGHGGRLALRDERLGRGAEFRPWPARHAIPVATPMRVDMPLETATDADMGDVRLKNVSCP